MYLTNRSKEFFFFCRLVLLCNFPSVLIKTMDLFNVIKTLWPGFLSQQVLLSDSSVHWRNVHVQYADRRWCYTGLAALKLMCQCHTLSLWLSFTWLCQRSAALILLIPVDRGGAKPLIAFFQFPPRIYCETFVQIEVADGLCVAMCSQGWCCVSCRAAVWTERQRASRCCSCHDLSRQAELSGSADLSVRRPADCRYSSWDFTLLNENHLHFFVLLRCCANY